MRKLLALAIIVIFTLAASPCLSGIPHLINYQGMLTNDEGVPLSGSFDLTFRIFDDSTSGVQKWAETQYGIMVTDGLFCVNLGDSTAIDLPFDENYWLEIEVGAYGSLSPRTRIVSVGYSYRAEKADTADYALAGTGVTDNDWLFHITDPTDTTLTTGGAWGITRYGNALYGSACSTHVNLGVSCTTGADLMPWKYCTVGGGVFNTARWFNATVGGGYHNTANSLNTTVGGGVANFAGGTAATIPGGYADTANGDWSLAAGSQVRISFDADYTFAFGRDFTTSTPNAVIFHNSVDPIKVGIGTTDPTSQLDVNSDDIRIRTSQTPASSSADGYTGEIAWDANYIYICTSGDGPGGATDSWKRAPLNSW